MAPKAQSFWDRASDCSICFVVAVMLGLVSTFANAAEVIPPKPKAYFNDYAGVVSLEATRRFNEQLAQFERDTSDQVVVAIFPKMQSDSDIADYGQRIAQAWGVGSKTQNNGALLLVFVEDRKISIQVGYGLEGPLPDAIAFDIRQYQIAPHFRNKDYEGGLTAGIDSIEKAIRGEYKGTGKTHAESRSSESSALQGLIPFIIFVIVLVIISRLTRRMGGYGYSGRGGPIFFPIGGGGGGWSSGGGGGGFSGFSGGGGSFGGGGSSGSW